MKENSHQINLRYDQRPLLQKKKIFNEIFDSELNLFYLKCRIFSFENNGLYFYSTHKKLLRWYVTIIVVLSATVFHNTDYGNIHYT